MFKLYKLRTLSEPLTFYMSDETQVPQGSPKCSDQSGPSLSTMENLRPQGEFLRAPKRSLRAVILAELTCPMERNLEAAFVRKKLKYASLQKELEYYGLKVSISSFEVSARGICAVTVSELLRDIAYGKKKSVHLAE